MSSQTHQGRLAGTRWDPNQYLKFADQRLRPALELLDRVPRQAPQVIYDLGCGTGQITRLIAEQWPAAKVYGLDNSPEMLAKAGAEPSSIHWIEADIQTWTPDEAPDLIYSNATLQWVDGHQELFPRLLRFLQPGGVLAAAFLAKSDGYVVADTAFPAVSINEESLRATFANIATDICITPIGVVEEEIRSGYSGMLFLSARAALF